MKRIITTITFVAASFILHAQIPKTFSFQGVLLDPATGQAKTDGSYDFTFRIYNVASGGSALWTEQQSLTTSQGQYSAILGSVTPIIITGLESYWLGIQVAPSSSELGRVKLTSSAYLLDDDLEDLADGSLSGSKVGSGIDASNVTTGTMSGNRISGGTVTAALSGSATTASRLTFTSGSPAQICCGSDVTLSDASGYMYIGSINGENMVLDGNEIQARNNGAAITLSFNNGGGNITMGSSGSPISVLVNGLSVHSSDVRLKSDISGLNYGLKEILNLNPVSYRWKKNPDAGTQLGFIAQEVKPVIGELVQDGNNKDDMLSVNYIGLIPVLIKAMQEQQAQIEELKSQVKELKNSSATTANISTGKE